MVQQSEKVAKLHPNLLFSLNILLELTLFGLFLGFFGIPSVSKYLAKETIVISSVEDTNGIEAPAVTIIARQTNAMGLTLGWKTADENMISIQNFKIVHHCKEINLTNLEACISNDTFGLHDFLKEAKLGLSKKASSSLALWTEDMTATFHGRHFTWKPSQAITRNETDALVFKLNTTSSFSYIGWVHDADFFLTNINPFSTPSKLWWINGNELNGTGFYRDLTLTKHKRLNLDRRPCEEDPSYSFTVCIKEKLSKKLGCRLPWDKWSQQERAVCTSEDQFNQFESSYGELANADIDRIVQVTGCKEPCNFKEYKFVDSSPAVWSKRGCVAFWAASQKTQREEEVLLYPFTSLIAEFGGSLGLFLGFSFLSIWQELRGYF